MTTTMEKPARRAKTLAGITLATEALKDALDVVLKAVPTRSARPIMQNVRLGDGLLTGSDLEIRIDRKIDYHGEPMLLPAHKLSSILGVATGKEVYLTAKDATVIVKCGTGEWTLPTENVAEYPHWEPAGLKDLCTLPAEQFGRAAKATTYAVDSESSRYALGGVLLDVTLTDDGSMQHWVATDGRRLACVETENDQAVDASQTIVPGRLMAAVSILATGNGSVQIEANSKEIRFTLDGCTITGRLLEGAFPNWRGKVAESEGEPTVIARKDLLQAVNAARIVTSEQSKGVNLDWTSGTLVLTGRSSEYGESLCECPTIASGTTASTRLDPHYLAQFLSHLPPDEQPSVDLYVKDAESRVLIKCGPYTGVIMPLAAEGN